MPVAQPGLASTMAEALALVISQHAGFVIVADGTDAAAQRLQRVLTNDPGTAVMRHADAGYDVAIECAREKELHLPMIE